MAGLTGSRFAWKQNIKIDIIFLLSDERELKGAARKAVDAFASSPVTRSILKANFLGTRPHMKTISVQGSMGDGFAIEVDCGNHRVHRPAAWRVRY